jgi:hypothetical protein
MRQEEILQEIKKDIRENLEINMSLDCTGKNPRTRRGLQHMMGKKYSESVLNSTYESIMNYSIRSEINCPGSGLLFLRLLTGLDGQSFSEKTIRNKSDMVSVLREKNFDARVEILLVEALEHLSYTSRLSIKKSSNQKSYIEVVDGYNFKVKPLFKNYLEITDVKVLCIDGYVESVSELHHLLTIFAEKKSTCLIFTRGMSEDVLHTIKVNNDRNIFRVYPYVIPFDPENVNTIIDIAVVSGTDVVSSTKGNLISSVDIKDLGYIEDSILSGEMIRMRNSATRNAVNLHRSTLKKTLEERPELDDIFSTRMRCLTSSCIDFCIPDDINFYSTSQQLDEGIRIISSIVNNTYSPGEVAKKFLQSYLDIFQNTEVFTLEQRCLL